MIVYMEWSEQSDGGKKVWQYSGWYLFGLIPLVTKRKEIQPLRRAIANAEGWR